MGDDLIAAQSFSRRCESRLDQLLTVSSIDQTETIVALTAISSDAKAVNARAISRASQTALDELSSYHSGARLQGNLLVLNKLLAQYRSGLNDLMPEEDSSSDSNPAELDALERARQTLLPLIRFAPNSDDMGRLSSLCELNVHPDHIPPTKVMSFDTIMPTLTNDVLLAARHAGKSVSVSYAANGVSMIPDLTAALEHALLDICKHLIEQTVEPPNYRQAQGLSQSAQIAITAHRRDDSFSVLVTCEGHTVSHADISMLELEEFGGRLTQSADNGFVKIEIADLRTGSEMLARQNVTDKELSA